MKAVLDFVLAALPIGLLVYWMTKKRGMASNRALPLAALVLYCLLFIFSPFTSRLIHAAVVEGFLTAFTPILIVLGATLLFKTMEQTGAISVVRQSLNGITSNRVAQLMIVGWAFSFLIEGVSGFGTPAALAAPLLVGLGFPPLPVVILCLMMNTVPVSFGAVGMPTWFGFGGLDLSPEMLRDLSFKTALMHAGAAWFIPLLALRQVVSWSEIRQNLGFIAWVIGATVSAYVFVARFSVEFPSIAGGIAALLVSVGLARRGIGLVATPAQTLTDPVAFPRLIKAAFPIWATVLILLLTRLDQLGIKGWLSAATPAWTFSLSTLGEWHMSPSLVVGWRQILGTELNWVHPILYVPSLIPFFLVSTLSFVLFRTPVSEVQQVWKDSFQRVMKPIGAFLGALIFVKLLMVGGEQSAAQTLGQGLATVLGGGWQFFAVYLGALGSFFSGSNTVSNLTFGGIQDVTATQLELSRTTILSLQSVGGAMGNMVCIHNIVAVCSILGLQNQEGVILRKTFVPTLLYGVIAFLISLLF